MLNQTNGNMKFNLTIKPWIYIILLPLFKFGKISLIIKVDI